MRRSARLLGLLVVMCLLSLPRMALPVHAQEVGSGRIAVVAVDDQAFPTVSLFLDVADANGAPVAGLSPANFVIQEEGQPAAIQAVTVDASQPLALLLALDRSTNDPATWAAVQGAAAAVISALGADDQVAITTIFDEVQPVQEFTANKDAALAALAAVTPGGSFSAINPAIVDAVNRFGDNLPARRAVIVVADAPDNISTVTAADVIAQVTGRGTPVYVVGFGANVQNEPTFNEIATATGGRFFAIGTANDLQSNLTALLPQLRQGYRVEFLSALPADNLPHTAQIQVTAPNVNGTATSQFVARPSTVEVKIPGLVAGQPVAGVVNLTAATTQPGSVANVEFRVDGVSIGTAPDLATPVVWDTSTLAPGPHLLTAIVTDSAGNQGEATVEVLVAVSAPRLDLLGVDHSLFPSVSTFVDAFGANGLPLVGLNSQSFTVLEDNRPVEPAQIAVSVDATQPLNLVLVLDRSVAVADWAQLRNAANSLVDALRPQDQMAVYTFAAAPTLVQQATGDANLLKSGIAAVEAVPPAPVTTQVTTATVPSGDNGLHQALLDGANLASTLPDGRRAVIVLTNGTDNTGQIALADLITALEAQPVPVHLLAFGVDSQSAGTLAGIAQLAGGNSVAVNSAADLRSALQTLILLLQQGYRLDFTSGLQADDAPHSLTVGLAAGGMEAETTGEFIARSRPITVTFPNVVEGATIAGAMNLTAQADAPAPIVSVVYRLNGDILAEVADTSFSIVWNSDTVEPGDYTVEAEVVDAVGNQGTASISFVVVAPVTVAASLAPINSDGDILVGDEVTIHAEAAVFSGQALVEFYVGRELINTDRQPPYSASFDSGEFEAGSHTITVIARDDAGHEAVSTFDFVLVAPPPPTPEATPTTASSLIPAMPTLPSINWGRIFTWVAIGLVTLVALLLIFSAIGSARRSAQEQKLTPMRLTLSNLGNVATGYLLRGEDAGGILNFRFSLNGVVLGLPPVARLTNDEGAAASSVSTRQAARPSFGGVQLPTLPQGSGDGSGEGGTGTTVGELADKLDEVSTTGRLIADILNMAAMILPPGLGRPIRRIAMQIRRGQMMANRVKTIRRRVDQLNKTKMGQQVIEGTEEAAGQVGRAATSDSTRSAVAQGASRAGGMVSATAAAAYAGASRTANRLYDLSGQGAHGANGSNGANGAAASAGPRQWVYLPPLNPGETVTIDVMVGAAARRAGGTHQPFRILSRALGEENAQPVVEEGSIRLASSSQFPSIMRWFLALLVLLIAATVIWWLASMLF
ncbi:MAG: VWA domain-containing protein [Caldilineaceae bacterium]|nr:VWA domain-containing protein [Caldilineaceae bacterium]